jgi:hypothetical protein
VSLLVSDVSVEWSRLRNILCARLMHIVIMILHMGKVLLMQKKDCTKEIVELFQFLELLLNLSHSLPRVCLGFKSPKCCKERDQ